METSSDNNSSETVGASCDEADVSSGDFDSLRRRSLVNRLIPPELSDSPLNQNSSLANGDLTLSEKTADTDSEFRETSSENPEWTSVDSCTTSEQAIASQRSYKRLKKSEKIFKALCLSDLDYLSYSAISKYGLVHDNIRQKVWPKLTHVDVCATSPRPIQKDIEAHHYYQQVLLDVNRSLKRFPPSIKEKQRLAMQDQLVLLIMRILIKNPKLHYYQGYHDICVTFLLVLGEEMSFYVVDKLSSTHLKVFLQKRMEPTMEMLTYLYPIIQRENPVLHDFLKKSDVGVIFALSWLITWFGHVLNNYSDVVRLFDFFIASDRWMPLYLSAAIVLHRKAEILELDCDMACVHSFLSNVPDDLPFEQLILESMRLYDAYPPTLLKKSVMVLLKKEADVLKAKLQSRRQGYLYVFWQNIKHMLPPSKLTTTLIFAAAIALSAVVYQSYDESWKLSGKTEFS